MIDHKLEYLFMLFVFGLVIFSILWDSLLLLLRKLAFWRAFAIFCVFCICVDTAAILLDWWHWSPERIIGLHVWKIPIEEFILIILVGLFILGSWESIRHDVE